MFEVFRLSDLMPLWIKMMYFGNVLEMVEKYLMDALLAAAKKAWTGWTFRVR